MKARQIFLAPILAATLSGCSDSSAVLPDHTILVQFSRRPTNEDVSSATALGAKNAYVINLIDAIALRTSLSASTYGDIDGVARIWDLGEDEDPSVSVFIDVTSEPTQEDLDFVSSLGATSVGALTTRNRIAADMPLSAVNRLEERDRFVAIEVVPPVDPIVIQP